MMHGMMAHDHDDDVCMMMEIVFFFFFFWCEKTRCFPWALDFQFLPFFLDLVEMISTHE